MPNLKKIDRRAPLEKFYCVVCGQVIDQARVIRKAVTCSEEHSRIIKLERRRLRDLTRCRACNRPSTPAERAEFAAWRKDKKARERAEKKAGKKAKSSPPQATPLEKHLGTVTVQ
jgi:predicted nucleic acid-binding Zn ribbon protein